MNITHVRIKFDDISTVGLCFFLRSIPRSTSKQESHPVLRHAERVALPWGWWLAGMRSASTLNYVSNIVVINNFIVNDE